MDNIFSMDNLFFRTVGKLVDLVWVNILTVICALPVVTAGASFTAMYYLLLRMADNDQGALTRGFFQAFRQNFKKATKVWIGILLISCVYLYNWYLFDAGALDGLGALKKISGGIIIAILAVTLIVSNYIFALLARYDNTLKMTIKNAFILMLAFFPRSLCIGVIFFFPLALMMLSDWFFWLWLLYGLTYPGYLIAMILLSVFRKTEDAEESKR